jgi:hypothetical protein
MNREDVVRMAREAGLAIAYDLRDEDGWQELERFAALVAAAERTRLFEIVRKKKVAATTEWAKLFGVEDF